MRIGRIDKGDQVGYAKEGRVSNIVVPRPSPDLDHQGKRFQCAKRATTGSTSSASQSEIRYFAQNKS
jgi:hypothetical protein